jgi:hypothetical protein
MHPRWTNHETWQLVALRAEGLTYVQNAERMGKTKSAIKGRIEQIRGREGDFSPDEVVAKPDPNMRLLPPPDWYYDYRLPTLEESLPFAKRLRVGQRVMTNNNAPGLPRWQLATVNHLPRMTENKQWVEVIFDDRPTYKVRWHVTFFDPLGL